MCLHGVFWKGWWEWEFEMSWSSCWCRCIGLEDETFKRVHSFLESRAFHVENGCGLGGLNMFHGKGIFEGGDTLEQDQGGIMVEAWLHANVQRPEGLVKDIFEG